IRVAEVCGRATWTSLPNSRVARLESSKGVLVVPLPRPSKTQGVPPSPNVRIGILTYRVHCGDLSRVVGIGVAGGKNNRAGEELPAGISKEHDGRFLRATGANGALRMSTMKSMSGGSSKGVHGGRH